MLNRQTLFQFIKINFQMKHTFVRSVSSDDVVESFWNARSNLAKSNGGRGKNAFLNVARGPRK